MSKLNIQKILSEHAKWLRGVGGNRAYLSGADLSHLDLQNACLSHANLLSANLNSVNLNSASLSHTNLRFADLRFADLRVADLSHADLRFADMRFADLRGADLGYADLRSAVLPKTDAILASPFGWCHVQRDYIRIGCQYRKTSSWRRLSDKLIDKMDDGALIWWKQHKGVVMAMAEACELHKEAGE
jgi:uncharacterized protein YjbI with pentapeptide repeats